MRVLNANELALVADGDRWGMGVEVAVMGGWHQRGLRWKQG